jgi:transposase
MQVETLDAPVRDYIKQLETSLREYQHRYLEIKERYDLLVYRRFVRSAEQLLADEKQQPLFVEETDKTAGATEKQTGQEEVKSYRRKKSGRRPIDPRLHREERILDIPDSEKTCACGAGLTRIGEEVSEKLHIEPPRIYVERTIRPKYACRTCEGTETEGAEKTVRIMPVEPTIIPRSIATPSLLSCIFVHKYEDHLPYYRQEKQFERIGVTISRQDMSNWQQQVYKKLKPIFGLLKETIISGPYIQMDETTVQVMGEENRKDEQKSYMWLARGGPPGKQVTLYEYHETRGGCHAKTFLSGYRGYLQTDGYEGYDAAVKELPGITHVGCFAHSRRKFFEAAKVMEQAGTAEEGINYIKKLYGIEKGLRNKYQKEEDMDLFMADRKVQAMTVLEEFKAWLMKTENEVPPSLLLGKAVGYSLNQWDKLVRYLESPYLTPDNNACENAIRPFVVGRKNWLFNQSPDGAESSCGMYSLVQTAKQNGLVPLKYLTALFEKAPLASSPGDWGKLLPWNIFKK